MKKTNKCKYHNVIEVEECQERRHEKMILEKKIAFLKALNGTSNVKDVLNKVEVLIDGEL